MTEAAAICAYLADAFPTAGLAPPPTIRAAARTSAGSSSAPAASSPRSSISMFARPPVERPGALGYGSYEATLHALERAIAPGWILGSQFSAADVYLGSQIIWGS